MDVAGQGNENIKFEIPPSGNRTHEYRVSCVVWHGIILPKITRVNRFKNIYIINKAFKKLVTK